MAFASGSARVSAPARATDQASRSAQRSQSPAATKKRSAEAAACRATLLVGAPPHLRALAALGEAEPLRVRRIFSSGAPLDKSSNGRLNDLEAERRRDRIQASRDLFLHRPARESTDAMAPALSEMPTARKDAR